MGANGKKVKGRYTFIYVYEDGEWKINQHHSSIMPEVRLPKSLYMQEIIITQYTHLLMCLPLIGYCHG